jgi:hypothetical protein
MNSGRWRVLFRQVFCKAYLWYLIWEVSDRIAWWASKKYLGETGEYP